MLSLGHELLHIPFKERAHHGRLVCKRINESISQSGALRLHVAWRLHAHVVCPMLVRAFPNATFGVPQLETFLDVMRPLVAPEKLIPLSFPHTVNGTLWSLYLYSMG